MKVVITGGAGFIGSHVAERLIDTGHEVHVLDDLSVGTRQHVPNDCPITQANISEDDLHEIFAGIDPDAVCHLAAHHYVPYCREHPAETYAVNAWGTSRVVDACHRSGVTRVVHASSAAVYTPDSTPHSEPDPTDSTDVYGRSKLVSEGLFRGSGIETRILRLFNVFGPRETNPHLIPEIIEQLGAGEVELGNLRPRRDFVHVRDVARAFELALTEQTNHEIFNIGTGRSYSVREVVETINAILDEPVEIVQDEERIRESDRPFLEASIQRAKTDLGWTSEIDFETGLRELLEYSDTEGVQPG